MSPLSWVTFYQNRFNLTLSQNNYTKNQYILLKKGVYGKLLPKRMAGKIHKQIQKTTKLAN